MLDSSKLENVKTRENKTIAACPACRAAGDDNKGEHLVIYSNGKFGCIAHEGDSLHRKDIFSLVGIPDKPVTPSPKPRRRIAKIYDYTDKDGELIHQTVRYEPKGFSQRRPDGKDKWKWSLKDIETVLYNLPAIAKSDSQEPIWIVEGEKDADALSELGYIATTSPMGAKKWRDQYSKDLKGRRVILCSDNDKEGRKHMNDVAIKLQGVACSVSVIDIASVWSDCPHKGDVSDYIKAGKCVEELLNNAEAPSDEFMSRYDDTLELLASGEDVTTQQPAEVDADKFMDQLRGMYASTTENLDQMRARAKDAVFIMPGLALAGQYTIINAQYNTGKTLISLWLLSQRDREATSDYEIIYVNADDTFEGSIDKSELLETMGVHTLIPSEQEFDENKLYWLMQSAIENGEAGRLVFLLDTLKKWTDPNDKKGAREFNLLVRKFVQAGGTFIALAHTNKNKGSNGKSIAEGVGDWASDCDCNYIVDSIESASEQRKAVVFKIEKLRGPNSMEMTYTYDNTEGKSWRDRFNSVEQLGTGEAQSLRSDMEAGEKHEADMPIIKYLEDRIYNSTEPLSTSALCQKDLEDGKPSRYERERVLSTYSDSNRRGDHQHWKMRTGKTNGKVFSVLDTDQPF